MCSKSKTIVYLILGCIAFSAFAQNKYRLEVEPLDFQSDDQFITPMISEIEFNGEHLVIQSASLPEFYQISLTGQLLSKHGRLGEGPGEFSGAPRGLGAFDHRICVIGKNGKRASFYQDGTFVKQFYLESYLYFSGNYASNAVAFVGNKVIVPCRRTSGALALAYDLDDPEKKQKVGRPLDFDKKILWQKRYLNDTMWTGDGRHAFAAFDYFPLILHFDESLNLVRQYNLDSPHFVNTFEDILEFERIPGKSTHPMPLIQDFQVTPSFFYLLSRTSLFRLARTSGAVVDVFHFYGVGDTFESLAGKNLVFEYMAVINDQKLILGHTAMPWGHDLWQVTLPLGMKLN